MTRQSGITLVELLITMAVATIVGLIIVTMYITSSRTYTDQNRILDAQRAGRIELEAMTRILRHAGLDPLRTAKAGVEVAEAALVTVTMDLNLDGDVADNGERVTFRRSGNFLQKGIGASWENLAEDVSAFRLDYFGEDNLPLNPAPGTNAAELAKVRSLMVTLTIRDVKAAGDSFERTYSTSICCRNLFR
jgi:Tfp pilus assembly protein PilW